MHSHYCSQLTHHSSFLFLLLTIILVMMQDVDHTLVIGDSVTAVSSYTLTNIMEAVVISKDVDKVMNKSSM